MYLYNLLSKGQNLKVQCVNNLNINMIWSMCMLMVVAIVVFRVPATAG